MGEVLGVLASALILANEAGLVANEPKVRAEYLTQIRDMLVGMSTHASIQLKVDENGMRLQLVSCSGPSPFVICFGIRRDGVGVGMSQLHQEILSAVAKLGFKLERAPVFPSHGDGCYTFTKSFVSVENIAMHRLPWWISLTRFCSRRHSMRSIGVNTSNVELDKIQELVLLRLYPAPWCPLPGSTPFVAVAVGGPPTLVKQLNAIILQKADPTLWGTIKKSDCHLLFACIITSGYATFGHPSGHFGQAYYQYANGKGVATEANEIPVDVGQYVFVKHADEQGQDATTMTEEDTNSQDSLTSVKCFLPNTAFKTSGGSYLPVQHLEVRTQVGSSNSETTVARVERLPKRHVRIVELVTGQGSIKVSENHRIITVSKAGGSPTVRRARELKANEDMVFVGAREQTLTAVNTLTQKTELFEVSFDPDIDVETFMVPSWGIHTRGEPIFSYTNTSGAQSMDPFYSNDASAVMYLLPQTTEEDLLRAMPTEYEE